MTSYTGQTSHLAGTPAGGDFNMWQDHIDLGRTVEALRAVVAPPSIVTWPVQTLDSQAIRRHQQQFWMVSRAYSSTYYYFFFNYCHLSSV